jgi:sortase (surface protein transpeptidase)
MPAISSQPDAPAWDVDSDWWGPTWDVVTSAGPATPASGLSSRRAAGVAAVAEPPKPFADPPEPVAEPPTPVGGPERPPAAAADPSWRRIAVTTIGLWVSRRMPRLAARASAVWTAHARLLSASMLGAGLLAAGAGTAGLVVAGGSPASAVPLAARPSSVAVPSGRAVAPVWLSTVRPTPRPVFLTIPAIGVRASIINLGLNPNGTLQVPRTTTVVGWYTGSPRPGATGSAIIAGHVDSRSGPGVFFWLRTMRRGDRIYVRRADGTLAVFTVTAVRIYPKDKFPTATVYGPVPDAELRLITCGGTFDYSTRSYLSNVVVYARLTK